MLSILVKASSNEYTLFALISSKPFCNFSFKSFLFFIVTLSGASVSKYDNFKYSIKLIHDKIEALDNYKKLDDYKDHFKALLIWCKKDKDKEEYKEKPKRRPKKDIYAFLKD